MFFAETKNGKRISADTYAVYRNKDQELYCPGCKAAVFCKNGTQKLAHFAHYAESDCQQFSEGETAVHLLGKQKLFDWLQNQNIFVQMEAWLPNLQQRPDLLLTLADGRKIVIEYQCSPIPKEKLMDRTNGYISNGYEVYWICGPDYYIYHALSQKQRLFFQHSKQAQFYLVCFNSVESELISYENIHYNKQNQLRYNKRKKKLAQLSFKCFEKLYKGEKTSANNVHPQELKNYYLSDSKRMMLLHRRDESHRIFLERIYINKQNLEQLPNWLFYLPSKSIFYQTPAYIWKYDFVQTLFRPEQNQLIRLADIYRYLHQSQLICYDMPFIKEKERLQPLLLFMGDLVEQGILKEVNTDRWIVIQDSTQT